MGAVVVSSGASTGVGTLAVMGLTPPARSSRRWIAVALVAGVYLGCARATSSPPAAGTKQSPSVFGRGPPQPVDKPWVVGSRNPGPIYQVIGGHAGDVKSCYERGLSGNADLAGRVSVEFIIAPTGRVKNVAVRESTLGNPPVEECILQSVRGWAFPAPEGGGMVIVGYPFHFLR
jgi:TonB family protein